MVFLFSFFAKPTPHLRALQESRNQTHAFHSSRIQKPNPAFNSPKAKPKTAFKSSKKAVFGFCVPPLLHPSFSRHPEGYQEAKKGTAGCASRSSPSPVIPRASDRAHVSFLRHPEVCRGIQTFKNQRHPFRISKRITFQKGPPLNQPTIRFRHPEVCLRLLLSPVIPRAAGGSRHSKTNDHL